MRQLEGMMPDVKQQANMEASDHQDDAMRRSTGCCRHDHRWQMCSCYFCIFPLPTRACPYSRSISFVECAMHTSLERAADAKQSNCRCPNTPTHICVVVAMTLSRRSQWPHPQFHDSCPPVPHASRDSEFSDQPFSTRQ